MPDDASQIGANLRAAREAAGLTQEEAARIADVSTNTVARWERGERRASTASVDMLLRAYNERTPDSRSIPNVPRETLRIAEPGASYVLPDALFRREHEIEHELLQAGVPPSGIREFRKSVRENPLLYRLFADRPADRVTTGEEVQLYENVARSNADLVRAMYGTKKSSVAEEAGLVMDEGLSADEVLERTAKPAAKRANGGRRHR